MKINGVKSSDSLLVSATHCRAEGLGINSYGAHQSLLDKITLFGVTYLYN